MQITALTNAKDHERLVDVARLAESLARGVRVFRTLRPCKINECEACCLDARWILSLNEP